MRATTWIAHTGVFLLAAGLFGACTDSDGKKSSSKAPSQSQNTGEASSSDYGYRMKPFNYTADEADHLIGVCLDLTAKVYNASKTLQTNPQVEKGSCTEEETIADPSETGDFKVELTKSCTPYAQGGTNYARLLVYDRSYRLSDNSPYTTTPAEAEAMCASFEDFAKLITETK